MKEPFDTLLRWATITLGLAFMSFTLFYVFVLGCVWFKLDR